MFKRLLSTAIIFGAAALAPPADAQQARACMPRDILVDRLSESYGEQPTGGGLQSPTLLVEIWSSPETGTFTVFLTRADGLSCLVASGRGWQVNADLVDAPEGEAS